MICHQLNHLRQFEDCICKTVHQSFLQNKCASWSLRFVASRQCELQIDAHVKRKQIHCISPHQERKISFQFFVFLSACVNCIPDTHIPFGCGCFFLRGFCLTCSGMVFFQILCSLLICGKNPHNDACWRILRDLTQWSIVWRDVQGHQIFSI